MASQTSECDVLVIGLGPAGMAVTIMAKSLGLNVIAIEKRKIGGECLNVGCIPSKAILRTAKLRHAVLHFPEMGLEAIPSPKPINPFARVRDVVKRVNEGKTAKMFESVDVILSKGSARFIDSHTVEVQDVRKIRAKKIFICSGTTPFVPNIQGLDGVGFLTNENLYDINEVPRRFAVIGGGAIGCEMGQALFRLGSETTILNSADCLLPRGDAEAGHLLCEEFRKEGIRVINKAEFERIEKRGYEIAVILKDGSEIICDKLLVAAGRKIKLDELELKNAGVVYDNQKGVKVDAFLRTSVKHIFACGDCNGYRQFTHAAMHQGMLALINAMLPRVFMRRYKDYIVPWSVFTEPEVSQVGETEADLQARGEKYKVIRTNYSDYGRTTADGSEIGFIKALCTRSGKILGVTIVGESSGEMIHEFGLAIQKGLRLTSILFLQHSFPTYSFMNKRIAEQWLMDYARKPLFQRIAKMRI
jgi:pyruvate/2-oxoglutarate dehydrogenase complex dihydrolipoamide dehydrogenase (E3) component